MPPPLPVLARRVQGRVDVTPSPTELTLSLHPLRSADGHELTVYLALRLAVVNKPADLQLYTEQLLAGADAVSLESLRTYFSTRLMPPAAAFVANNVAEVSLTQKEMLSALLHKQVDAIAFGCGLERISPLTLSLDSPSLARAQQLKAARQRQLDDLDHAAKLSQKLASIGDLAKLPAADKAAVLPSILASAPAVPVLLAVGVHVAAIDASNELTLHATPPGVGPLRSVRAIGDGQIAAGGTTGIVIFDNEFQPVAVYPGGDGSARGFNSVVPFQGNLLAGHGGVGLARWNAGDPKAKPETFAVDGTPRFLTLFSDDAWFAVDQKVCAFDGQTIRPIQELPATVIGLTVLAGELFAFAADGTVAVFNGFGKLQQTTRLQSDVAAATATMVNQTPLILSAGGSHFVDGHTLDGQRLLRLNGLTATPRMLLAAGRRVAAVSSDRSSVTLWHATAFDSPQTFNLLARTGNSITELSSGA